MTNEQLPESDNDPLERWEPTAAQRAPLLELWYRLASGDPDFPACYDVWVRRRPSRTRALPQAGLAILRHGTATLINAQGRELTLRRLAADLELARAEAAKEATTMTTTVEGIGPQLERASHGPDPQRLVVFEYLARRPAASRRLAGIR